MVRKYKKRTYKPRKRTYKRRYYKRRYYKRRFKPIKKPEIHILEETLSETAFNHLSQGMGSIRNLTPISSSTGYADPDEAVFSIQDKKILGSKIRLKYLYIKGYIKVSSADGGDADDFNCKLMVFRWKRNTTNYSLNWSTLINGVPSNTPSNWTEQDRLSLMYKQDWKNDIKINFYKKVKNLYRKYDDANNIIPFKIRIPLYDCVLSCDLSYDASNDTYTAQSNPSTNGLYFTFLSNIFDNKAVISYKTKLYYTDY